MASLSNNQNVSRNPAAPQTESLAIPVNSRKPLTDIPRKPSIDMLMNSTPDATGSCIYI